MQEKKKEIKKEKDRKKERKKERKKCTQLKLPFINSSKICKGNKKSVLQQPFDY